MTSEYFNTPHPRLFAHRGLALERGLDENTLEAFAEALKHGATHLESDTQATADGHAVLLHDADLSRVAGVDVSIGELSLSEAQSISLTNGGRIPTLIEALESFPEARFNLDIKTRSAISPTVSAIEQTMAHNRILLSSFANPIRRSALSALSRPVATSASQSIVVAAYLSHKLAFGLGFSAIVSGLNAFQIPPAKGAIRFADERFIQRLKRRGVEVHFWTINDPEDARQLLERGADGIVSDRVDLMNLR